MKTPATIVIPLSAGREVRFTAIGGRIQTIARGFIHPRELSEARSMALQKLADEARTTLRDGIETYQPRRDPGQPARNYQTRLIPRIGGGRCSTRKIG